MSGLEESWKHLADEQLLDRKRSMCTLDDVVRPCIKEYYRPDLDS